MPCINALPTADDRRKRLPPKVVKPPNIQMVLFGLTP
jgi:hypothetical protein